MKTARYYQTDAANALYYAIKGDIECHPVAAIPTGSGKTLVMCEFIDTYLSENPLHRILVLSHVKEILEQNYAALEEHFDGITIGLYSAGLASRTIEKITVAGIQSIYTKSAKFSRFNVVIIDECHLVNTRQIGMYRTFLDGVTANYVGLTATAFRTGHGYIHIGEEALFNKLVYNMCDIEGFKELIDKGYLCRLIAKGTGMKLNTSGLKTRMNDYIPKQMSDRFDRDSITKMAVKEIIEYGQPYKKWLVFAIDIKHAKHIAAELNRNGIDTACVHSKMETDRDVEIYKFKSGKYRCLVNVNILTTGFDAPDIDLIAMLRPTQSPVLHIQSLGRGMRPFTYENGTIKDHCLVLDFAGNVSRLGPINDVEIEQNTAVDGTGGQRMKECPNCQGLIPIQARECEYCGHKYPVREKIQERAYEGDIIRLDSKPKPKREWLNVTSIKYHHHVGRSGLIQMKASYLCGFKSFHEYICYDHPRDSFAKYRANAWVKFRLLPGSGMPADCEDLIRGCRLGGIKNPKRILITLGGKFPSIDDMTF